MANGMKSPQHDLPFTSGQAMEQYLMVMRSTSKVRRMMTSTSSVTEGLGKGMASAQPLTRMANGMKSPQHDLPFTNGQAMEQYLMVMRSTSKVRRMMTSTSSVTHLPGKGMASAQPLTRKANGRESPQHNLPFTNGQ